MPLAVILIGMMLDSTTNEMLCTAEIQCLLWRPQVQNWGAAALFPYKGVRGTGLSPLLASST